MTRAVGLGGLLATLLLITANAGAGTGVSPGDVSPGGRAAVTADHQWLVYDGAGPVVEAYRLDGTTQATLSDPCSAPFEEKVCSWAIAPANRVVWADQGTGTITLRSLAGGTATVIASHQPNAFSPFAELGPITATAAMYVHLVEGVGIEASLRVAPLDGSGSILVAAAFTSYAVDDELVAFFRDTLYLYDIVAGSTTAVDIGSGALTGVVRMAFTPDGSAVIAFHDQGVDLIPLDGSGRTHVANYTGEVGEVRSTTTHAVFDTGSDIYSVPLDGSAVATRIVDDAASRPPWEVSGDGILYAVAATSRPTGPGLYATAVDGATTRHLSAAYPGRLVDDFVISTDGITAAYVLDDPTGPGPHLVVTRSIDDPTPQASYEGRIDQVHHLDAYSVIFSGWLDGRVVVLTAPLTGTAVTELTRGGSPADYWPGNIAVTVHSTHADRVVFSIRADDGTVWLYVADDATPVVVQLAAGGTFGDDDSSVHRGWIEAIHLAGVTKGCGDGVYCPSAPVTRQQMASFLARAFGLAPISSQPFEDVDVGNPHAGNIAAIAAAQISLGCDPDGTRFCPLRPVTREQMASFIARAMSLSIVASEFSDVSAGNVHAGNIGALAEAQITAGCGPNVFCPKNQVTRAQMATFLGRALDLNPFYRNG